jgi:hypothetical protein
MRWRQGAEGEPGDEPDPGFGPSRGGAHHDDRFYGDDTSGIGRDERLAGFAPGGKQENRPPSARLAALLESVSGPGWQCPGAAGEEMIGLARQWAAVESWACAAKLGVIRALIRHEDKPWQPADKDTDVPDPWTETLTHNLALALSASVGSAERTEWLAWEFGPRLPGIGALLADGTLTYGKAKAIAEAFRHLSDESAAHAEALILDQLAGKTYLQVLRLATMAAAQADPEGAERRRKEAEKKQARVRLWREQSGAAGLGGFDLPTDETLAAHDNVCARAGQYQACGAFPGAKLDQLRAMAYLDLLNSVTAQDRIANARTPAGPDNPAAPAPPDGAPEEDPDDGGGGGGDAGDSPDNRPGPDDGDGDGDGDPGGGGGGPAPDPGPRAAARPGTDLIIPLMTLLGLGRRPGEAYRLGPLDPGLCRQLAALAAASPTTELCLTVTDDHGYAIGHGCTRTRTPRTPRPTPDTGLTALAARINLTIPLTDLQNLTRPDNPSSHASPAGSPGPASPWALTPRHDDHGPPGGHGTWTLTIPGGREFTVRLEQVPVHDCDHARQSRGYQPSDTLRHLVQVRDAECTFPTCTRHARESDFEHAIPYHKGGRTCACNAGARSRKCHRIKQSKGWTRRSPNPDGTSGPPPPATSTPKNPNATPPDRTGTAITMIPQCSPTVRCDIRRCLPGRLSIDLVPFRHDTVRSQEMRLSHPRIAVAGTVGLVAALALAAAAAVGPATRAQTLIQPESSTGIAGWTQTGSYNESVLSAGEGVATVDPPGDTAYELYRGAASIPLAELINGWTHIGDPDSADGYIIDAYQGSSSGNKKMFLLTTPSGATYQYMHTLVSGELYNNSFDAISPDTRWMVSGEWGTMTHFQIYPTPYFNSTTSPNGGMLTLSGYISLNTPVDDIQGCDFVTATKLVCASDDSSDSIFTNKFPLLEITVAAPLNGSTVSGMVTDLGSIPQNSICSGTFEPEGVDYDAAAGVLRVEITQPSVCEVATTVYDYRQN